MKIINNGDSNIDSEVQNRTNNLIKNIVRDAEHKGIQIDIKEIRKYITTLNLTIIELKSKMKYFEDRLSELYHISCPHCKGPDKFKKTKKPWLYATKTQKKIIKDLKDQD